MYAKNVHFLEFSGEIRISRIINNCMILCIYNYVYSIIDFKRNPLMEWIWRGMRVYVCVYVCMYVCVYVCVCMSACPGISSLGHYLINIFFTSFSRFTDCTFSEWQVLNFDVTT